MAMKSTGPLGSLCLEHTLILIELIHEQDAVWDVKCAQYRHPLCKQAAWTSIRIMFSRKTGIECTDAHVQSKFRSLKNHYTRELRLIKESKRKGTGRITTWPFFSALDFLRAVILPSKIPFVRIWSVKDDAHLYANEPEVHQIDGQSSGHPTSLLTADKPVKIEMFSDDTEQDPSSQDDIGKHQIDGQYTRQPTSQSSADKPMKIEMFSDDTEQDHSSQDDIGEHCQSPLTPSTPAAATPSPCATATPYRCAKRPRQSRSLQASRSPHDDRKSTENQPKEDEELQVWANCVGRTLAGIKNHKRRKLLRIQIDELICKTLREELSDLSG